MNESQSNHTYSIPDFSIAELTNSFILKHSQELNSGEVSDLYAKSLDINTGLFSSLSETLHFPDVEVTEDQGNITLTCHCKSQKNKLCRHQSMALYAIMTRQEIRIFFDRELRREKLRQFGKEYGLTENDDPEKYFKIEQGTKTYEIKTLDNGLLPVSLSAVRQLKEQLILAQKPPFVQSEEAEIKKKVVVFKKHKYYEHFNIELFEAATTKEGKLKNPLVTLQPLDLVLKTDEPEEMKFYTTIARFQYNFDASASEAHLESLRSLIRNPLHLDFFYHQPGASGSLNAQSLVPVQLKTYTSDIHLVVDKKDDFYHITGHLIVDEKSYELKDISIRFDYFILLRGTMYLIDHLQLIRIIDYFKQKNNKLLIHESGFDNFRKEILAGLEDRVLITYSYLRPATSKQAEETGFDSAPRCAIYLSDSEDFVLITPIMRYGHAEIPVLSKRQIYATDHEGVPFSVPRDEAAEIRLTAVLLRQHPDFEDQMHNDFFYLHKKRFLDENWFVDAFEVWRSYDIEILGFNELKKNRFNGYKAKVSVSVSTGINWFDTTLDVRFGQQKATLKHLYKSIRNKNKFVQLDDGTLGILPEEWLEKMSNYFESGEISGERIRTPRITFLQLRELYDEEMLSSDTQQSIAHYSDRLSQFESIRAVEIPEGLKANLRDYQKQGLNWLSFLDEFGFGGCLADDMGLGKTLQVIAFILSQRQKTAQNTNLVVVPTSLLFNWQEEVEKFAPSLKVLTVYGAGRVSETATFDQYDIILTSYGTMLSDIRLLKQYYFNYVILDESQNIKNPESQRYKAACLLQSRNKIVMSGTPLENNTYDLFGQLSFACPGLLGTKFRFKTQYATPIDGFGDMQRAVELRKKISPFILRRTKQQVAKELPEKTEMVLYCEMGEEQRKVYNAYEKEFRMFLNTRQEGDIPRERLHILQGLTKLRQICNSPALLSDEEYYGSESSKIEALMEQIENKSGHHKILVFSQFVVMLDLIRQALEARKIGFEYLTGQTRDRAARVNNFQNNPEVRVFLISLKAGGTGLNLTEADYVFLVDPWWNPAVEDQAIDRSYRIGQKKNVVAVRLICPGTIEEKIVKLQSSKKDLTADLIRTDNDIIKKFTKTDLLGLLD